MTEAMATTCCTCLSISRDPLCIYHGEKAYLISLEPGEVYESRWHRVDGVSAFQFDAWHEDDHDVLWWHFPIREPPYVGSPLASDWPFAVGDEHALGWTRFVVPLNKRAVT
jgi:hypothetical protein